MTRDEIVTALRCCAEIAKCYDCPIGIDDPDCIEKMAGSAADLIENQQTQIAALMQANAALRDTILRRDKEIEILKKQGKVMAQEQDAMGKRIAMMEKEKWTKTY